MSTELCEHRDLRRDCDCLPIRVVVDQHGHYWRDYGDHWSMCPVSDENTATEPVTEFYRFGGDCMEGVSGWFFDGWYESRADVIDAVKALQSPERT